MRVLQFLVSASVFIVLATAGSTPLSSVPRDSNLVSPLGYIIEVESTSKIPSKRSPQAVIYDHLSTRGVNLDVIKEYNTEGIFVGAAVKLKDAGDVDALRRAPGVVAIRPIALVPPPQPVDQLAVKIPSDGKVPTVPFSTHHMTGVDRLHAEGYLGQGVSIGIIDTGVDYTHPALGGKFGPGNVIVGGHDFVGDDYNLSDPVEDDDPFDECIGHGTHVAGILAAQPNNPLSVRGVAYKASINAYRIFGCYGPTQENIVVDAMLRAYNDGNEIITLSLGAPNGWTEATYSVVASRIANQGRVVTVAAGNNGGSGAWYTSAPGNGLAVISVGSVNNIGLPIQSLFVNNADPPRPPVPYWLTYPLEVNDTRPIYATSTDSTIVDDACEELPDTTPDLSEYVVVIRRGTCAFALKLDHARAKGATAVLVYNNVPGLLSVDWGAAHDGFPVVLITAEDGAYLVSEFAAGAAITVTFPQTGGATVYPTPDGGLMSSFSTYGPTNDLFFKPAVSAPGANIMSTVPVSKGSYVIMSGTSMATPFVAGVSALLIEAKGKSHFVALGARSLFEITAAPIVANPDEEGLQTLLQQGAGLIQAYDAVHANITISTTELLLNDTANYLGYKQFTLTNTGVTTLDFQVRHIPAATALTIREGTIDPNLGPVPLIPAPASVELSQESMSLKPGTSQTIWMTFSPPEDVDPSTFPVYSGFIEFWSPTESYRVSYLGVAAALKDKQILDDTDRFFQVTIPALLNATGHVQEEPTEYTFEEDDYPTLLFRTTFGTPHIRVDLVDENIDFNATYPQPKPARRGIEYTEAPEDPIEGIPTVGSLSESFWVPRNDESTNPWFSRALANGTFANGTEIPPGNYRMLLRALKVTGDKKVEDDYESWLSPAIIIKE